MPSRIPRRVLLVLLLVLPALLAFSPPAARADEERWYVVELEGKRAGYAHARDDKDGPNIRSSSEMKLQIKRGALSIPISIKTIWIESPDGKPLTLDSTSVLGALPTRKLYTFGAKDITVETTVGSQKSTETLPLPEGKWLAPAALDRELKRRLAAGEKSIVLTSIEDEPGGSLSVTTATRTILEKTSVDVAGKTVPALKTSVSMDRFKDLLSTEFISEDGESLRSEINMGGIRMVQLLADKDLALSPVDAPELLLSTLVKPDRPIANPRRLKDATYVLSVKEGAMPDLPTTPAQRPESVNPKTTRLIVSGAAAPDPLPPKAGDQGDDAAYLASSSMLKTDDPEVAKLVKKALPKEIADPVRRAEALRRFVHRFIKAKDLSVGFASASEVARTQTGDCTEHGVLLAAFLRVAGIPSRVASGLLYVDQFQGREGIFGYHMWAQAWLPSGADAKGPSRWVDLDATLDDDTPTDATHILIGASSLSDAQTENFMIALAPLLGRLQIKVEKTQP